MAYKQLFHGNTINKNLILPKKTTTNLIPVLVVVFKSDILGVFLHIRGYQNYFVMDFNKKSGNSQGVTNSF